jgi:hypothetical protein
MSDLIFNLRIGKLHIQITTRWEFRLSLNNYHRWLRWPFIELYEPPVRGRILPRKRRNAGD